MKNYVYVLFILAFMVISCNKKEYQEMNVYPMQKETVAAQGSDSFIVIQVEIPSRSHIYGNPKGPGTGKPTEVFVTAPKNIAFGKARFLKPNKYFFPGEKDYVWGYEHETKIFLPFKVAENATTGNHEISVVFDSLLCSDTGSGGASFCVPKIYNFKSLIQVVPKGMTGTAYGRVILEEYGKSSEPAQDGSKIHRTENGTAAIQTSLPTDLKFSPRYMERTVTGLFQAILFGIIAGLLLNIMPCVLPVVSLKVMGFIQHAGKSRKELFLLGLLFSLGIIASFAVLAALAAFFGYQWGGLFQYRAFLVAMTGIVFALALSLFGVFTINIPSFAGRTAHREGNQYGDAFLKGLLATLLATPCSGPFLGGTLAWTLTQPPGVIFLIFISIGAGMALPYLILTINPVFLKYIPKPGEWLVTFEKVMAFFLVFTVIYLIGILDSASIMPMIAFLGFIAFGFWQYGKYGSPVQSRLKRLISIIALIGIIVTGYLVSFEYLYSAKKENTLSKNQFSVERFLGNRESGKISVIEFTADWCPNCKLVEKATLQNDRVVSALRDLSVDFMVADITGKNGDAEKLMQLFKSQAIPLLAVVPPGEAFTRPIILRDIYSKDDVLKALHSARSDKNNLFKYQVDIQGLK
ncbi:MAG: thioredoxin family protein [Spirochaetes bacterium]|nr:thioredoxin family protein [Spirochaetota bacterium]